MSHEEREREIRFDSSKEKRRKVTIGVNREIIRAIEQKEIPILRRRRIGGERKGLFFSISFARDDAKDETRNDRDGRGRKREREGSERLLAKEGFFSLPLLLLFFARRIRETASKNIREAKLESN